MTGARPLVVDVGRLRPYSRVGNYLALEDYGLIGDGATAALVARDGSVDWLCLPRFDAPPLFCALLDWRRGGRFAVELDGLTGARQWYEPDTGVLVTELTGGGAVVRVTDAMALRRDADLEPGTTAAAGALVRRIAVLAGPARVRVVLCPHGGATVHRDGAALRLRPTRRPGLELGLHATVPLDGADTALELASGDDITVWLTWPTDGTPEPRDPAHLLSDTRRAWRRWAARLAYDGPQERLVRRSAVTLKLLDHVGNGAVVAAPTSSLPERIGGERNWDYRFTWVRDAAFCVYAFRRVGLRAEASHFLRWVLAAVDRAGQAAVLYDLDGRRPAQEREDPELEGYRRSRPVRWGNDASEQAQHDAYGEILDCAWQFGAAGVQMPDRTWRSLRTLAERAARVWRTPDRGIWEVRSDGRRFTYSAAMCHVALDRAARLADRFALPGDHRAWAAEAGRIRKAVLHEAWDPEVGALMEDLRHPTGSGASGPRGLDASLLALPLRRVLPARHPRMMATVTAITEQLDAGDGLLYRYRPEVSPDGLDGDEGAFLLCSFWLVDNLALQGRLDEATDLYDRLCARASPVGLLSEQIDPSTGMFLGNHPQAFSHVGVVSSGINLAWHQASGATRPPRRAPRAGTSPHRRVTQEVG